MSDKRRFNEDEVAKILEQAASPEASGSRPAGADPDGMTLAQLQEIGSEVGIEPERIAAAAGAVVRSDSAPGPRLLLGVPRSVSRTVPIGRTLDEDEWTRLVVDLRETFGAVGRIKSEGTLRSWNNGNLQIHVEPEGDGWRVRMRTLKSNAVPRLVAGGALIVTSIALLVSGAVGSGGTSDLVLGSVMGLGGLVHLGATRVLLKRWAADRAAQMEGLAERIPRLLKRADPEG